MTERFNHPYSLIRSQRRTLSLEIKPGGVLLVRAPKRLPLPDIERFIATKGDWIQKHLNDSRPAPSRIEPQEEKRLRDAAARKLPGIVEHYACRMGVYPAHMRITFAKKRLGSCSAKGGICFSFRLMAFPDEVIDYVVVHELAHLVELNHSADFYRVIARIIPDFRERLKILKQSSPDF